MNPWWQSAVVYQVWPRSFQDSDGDGIGDLRGHHGPAGLPPAARRRRGLDLALLPLADGGFRLRRRRLLRRRPALRHAGRFRRAGRRGACPRPASVHAGLRANHTVGPAPLVRREPQRRATTRKRDWYIWRDPAPDGGPPNNWLSEFGGSAWTLDAATGQYFYHAYLPQQPDLNWRNPDVQDAMLDVLRFWLDRGVDGFRVDAIQHLFEDAESATTRPTPIGSRAQSPARSLLRAHTTTSPRCIDHLAAMRRVAGRLSRRPPADRRGLAADRPADGLLRRRPRRASTCPSTSI